MATDPPDEEDVVAALDRIAAATEDVARELNLLRARFDSIITEIQGAKFLRVLNYGD